MTFKSKRRLLLWVMLALVGIGALALGGSRFVQRRVRADDSAAANQTAVAFVGDLTARISASGQMQPQREARLTLTQPDIVDQVLIEEGDTVKAGQVLVRLDAGSLERAVRSSEQALVVAQANLAELLEAPDSTDIAAAKAAVDSAQAQLDELLAGPSQQDLAQAQAAVTSAQLQLDDLLAGPTEEQVAQAQAALESARAALQVAKERYDVLDDQLIAAQTDLHNAQLAKDRARDQYNQLVWNDWKAGVSWAPYSPQGMAVDRAEVDYQIALARINIAKSEVNDSGVRSAQAQVAAAEANLAALNEEKTVQIAAARAQLAQAEAYRARLTEEQTVQIASTEAQLAQTQATLQDLLDGPSAEEIAIAQARVEKAKVSLHMAKNDLDKAVVVAPFDGVVTNVYVKEGELAGGLAVELADPSTMVVNLNVDEVDVGMLQVGQVATVTFEPWPGEELDGKVISIAPGASIRDGIASYEVQLQVQRGDLPVRAGMTANADLVTATRQDVLLVPNRAIIADRRAGKYYVSLVQDSQEKRVEVTIGLRDDQNTEVTSGLQAGDILRIGETVERLDFTQGPPPGVRELD